MEHVCYGQATTIDGRRLNTYSLGGPPASQKDLSMSLDKLKVELEGLDVVVGIKPKGMYLKKNTIGGGMLSCNLLPV